jgi:hypothetical protein
LAGRSYGGGDGWKGRGGGDFKAGRGSGRYAGKSWDGGKKWDGGKHHRHGKNFRRFYGPDIFVYGGTGSGYNDCGWLRRQAVITGSPYWWQRYQDCLPTRQQKGPAPAGPFPLLAADGQSRSTRPL